ncbi:hypothetical protein J6P92_05415, partial [bacterium]|nr:hypothetical protein [bacterium]
HSIYNKIADACLNTKQHKYIKELNASLNEAYDYIVMKFNPMHSAYNTAMQRGYELLGQLHSLKIMLEKLQ